VHPDTRLLDHPFYQAWERGDVTRDQLAAYGVAYQEFMDRVPDYWARVLAELDVDEPAAETVVDEEREHADLWERWRVDLPDPGEAPELTDLYETLESMSAAELAGAIHAYESQQPAVAETKQDGLCEFYGLGEADLTFFEEHRDEAEHIALGETIRAAYADKAAFDRGFERGAEAVYHSLDAFVAG
jgi:pyrroloquinoline-quinone synthase